MDVPQGGKMVGVTSHVSSVATKMEGAVVA